MFDNRLTWQTMHDSKSDALDQFRDFKFGMFIHWGVYSMLGGCWQGERMEDAGTGPCVAEWIMRRKSIPRDVYAELARQFNPVRFDADEWGDLAAAAGMRYMVPTAKHHDGFALFKSTASAYNIVDHTPFTRDPFAELHAACVRRGLRLGAYYSNSLDWYDGGDGGYRDYGPDTGAASSPKEGFYSVAFNDWDPPPGSFDEYLRHKALPQINELTTRYPDLFLIWFDTPCYLPQEISETLYRTVYDPAPTTLVNSRVSAHEATINLGDYRSLGDNEFPARGPGFDRPWETPGTLNRSWGYKSYDHAWKRPREIVADLMGVVSKGGNYLLNVGPRGDGSIPEESADILREVGKWLRQNGRAVYATRPWRVHRETCAGIADEDGVWYTSRDDRVFAVGLSRPDRGRVALPALRDEPVAEVVAPDERPVAWRQTQEGLEVSLPTDVFGSSDLAWMLEIRIER